MAPWTQSLMGGVRLGLAVFFRPALTLEIRHEKSISARGRIVTNLQQAAAELQGGCSAGTGVIRRQTTTETENAPILVINSVSRVHVSTPYAADSQIRTIRRCHTHIYR